MYISSHQPINYILLCDHQRSTITWNLAIHEFHRVWLKISLEPIRRDWKSWLRKYPTSMVFPWRQQGRRDMAITHLNKIKEKWVATTVGQAKQCSWMNWEGIETGELSRSSLMTTESLALSFFLSSTESILPNPANHNQWDITRDDCCVTCKSARVTLRHVLSSCGSPLQMYTERHNRVHAILAELTGAQCRVVNEQPTQDPNPMHQLPPRRRGLTLSNQQTTRPKVSRSCKGLKDGSWHKRSSSLPAPHHAYPGTLSVFRS